MGSVGITKLRKIQLARETTAGTNVSGSTIWRGTGVIVDEREIVFVEEHVGYKSGVLRTYTPTVLATVDLEEVPATYEQILHLCEMGIETVSPSQDGGASGYIYTYPFATNSDTASVKTYSIEGGDNIEAEEFSYGFAKEINISGSAGEAVMMSGTVTGRQCATASFSSTATLPSVEEILFQKGKLYIDADDGTMGATQVTNTWREFDLSITTGWQEVLTGDGELYFSFIKNIGAEVTCDFVFEYNASAVAEVSAWRNEAVRQIRLAFTGSTFVSGVNYANKTMYIDLAGQWESFSGLEDADGDDTITGTFRAGYDSTSTNFAQILVCTNLASIP